MLMFPKPLALSIAYVLDNIFGDPHFRFHPVRLIGDVAEFFRKIFFRIGYLGGLFTVVFTEIVVVYVVAFAVKKMGIFEPIFLYFFIAEKALRDEAMKVYKALKVGDIELARRILTFIVGRDTKNLSHSECIRAAVETVAENFSDGFVGPIFYYLLGGIKALAFYKVAETLDSMYGYKFGPYRRFGFFPAKFDDLLNFIPSKIAGGFIVLSAWLTGYKAKEAFKVMFRDAKKHDSPNAGWPEAAMAGALGIQLGGRIVYQGQSFEKPLLGDHLREREIRDIKRAVTILRWAAFTYFLTIFLMEVCLWRFNYPHLIKAIIKWLKNI